MAARTRSTIPATRRLTSHQAGRSGRTGGAIDTSMRLKGHSESVPVTATGHTDTPAWSAK